MKNYLALIEEDNGNYGVVFPDLPGLVSAGKSFDDAVRNAHEILAFFAETGKLPKARTLEQIKKNWKDWKEWKNNYNFVVASISCVPVTTRVKRVNIVMNEGLLARLDTVTKNRSEFISKAVESFLGYS
jgi:predicted RNase H-like HicB family nuclease